MFLFLQYIQPANYYRLIHKMPQAILLDKSEKTIFYKNEYAASLDQLYYKLQSGEIPTVNQKRNDLQSELITDTFENYIFIRRYFSVFQIIYVLFLRLLGLNNPIKEIYCFLYSLTKVSRIKINPKNNVDWNEYQSNILKSSPLISIIIPSLNRYKYLKDVLMDLEKQDYKNFEVIIVDQSEPIDSAFYQGWDLNINLIHQEEKALWLARNSAIEISNGAYILLFDDDSRVEPNWIQNHLKCIDYFGVKISAGVTKTLVGGGLGSKDSFFHLSEVFDTGNAMVCRTVFEEVGLFDRQFEKQRMGDSEFGLRALLGGYRIISNPFASRVHLKVETGGLRQMGSWDALRPTSLFAPRPIPSVLYLIRKYHGKKEAILYLIKHIPQSYIPYMYKSNKFVRLGFLLFFPLLMPIAIISVTKSWNFANTKIKEGSLISELL
jgi:glycosyltransferase involved in cell wall biosynthesis